MSTAKNRMREKPHYRGAKVTIVGLEYGGLPVAVEFTEAGYSVVGVLRKKGADVVLHDPRVSSFKLAGEQFHREVGRDTLPKNADCVVILTDHSVCDCQHILNHTRLMADTRHTPSSLAGQHHVVLL